VGDVSKIRYDRSRLASRVSCPIVGSYCRARLPRLLRITPDKCIGRLMTTPRLSPMDYFLLPYQSFLVIRISFHTSSLLNSSLIDLWEHGYLQGLIMRRRQKTTLLQIIHTSNLNRAKSFQWFHAQIHRVARPCLNSLP
jgi:hypothetical protein